MNEGNSQKDIVVGCLCALGCEVIFGLSYLFTKQATGAASELFAGRAGKRRGGSLDDAPAKTAEKPAAPAAPAAAPAPAAQAEEAPKARTRKPSIDIMMEDE